MSSINYISGGTELLDQVKPLWEALGRHHQEQSLHFSDFFKSFNFEMRRSGFEKAENLMIVLAVDNKKAIGYAVSSVNNSKGEIDSIYINQAYRGLKIGETFMTCSLKWIESYNVKKIILGVGVGNEQTFGFYEKFGFYPKVTILERKIKG